MLRYLGICLLGGGLVSGQAAGEAHLTGHCPTDYDCNEDRDHSVLNDHFTEIHINATYTAECFCDAEAGNRGDECGDYALLCQSDNQRKLCIEQNCGQLEVINPQQYQSCVMTKCRSMQNFNNNGKEKQPDHPAYVKKRCIKSHCNGLRGIQYRYCRAGYCGKGEWANKVSKCVIQPWKKNDVQRYRDLDGNCRSVLRDYRKYFFNHQHTTTIRKHIKKCWVDSMQDPQLNQCVSYATDVDQDLNRKAQDNYYGFMNGVFNVFKDSANVEGTRYGYCLFTLARKLKTCTFREMRWDGEFDIGKNQTVTAEAGSGSDSEHQGSGRSMRITPTVDYSLLTLWPAEEE